MFSQLIKFPINVPDIQKPIHEPFIIYKDTTTKIDNIDQQNKKILNNQINSFTPLKVRR